MLARVFSALGRLIALALFGVLTFLMAPLALLGVALVYALVLGLALVSLVGLVGGPICLLLRDYWTGLMLLGAGACAWVVNMFILDWVFGPRSGRGSVSIPVSLRIYFDR